MEVRNYNTEKGNYKFSFEKDATPLLQFAREARDVATDLND